MIEGRSQAELEGVIRKLEEEAPIPEDTFRPFYSMTWEMLDEIHRAGMTIGSHTRTHVLMTNESKRRVTEEAAGSRKEIERRLGASVRHFAYPSGVFDTAAVDAVAAAGYRFGYTTCSHRDAQLPQLTAPRTLLWENSCCDSAGRFSGSILSCQIHGVFNLVSGCRQRHAASQESKHDRL
jgi:peptidoglycan/xylan/chitin deacetylase (PgdA/CDA1 family)